MFPTTQLRALIVGLILCLGLAAGADPLGEPPRPSPSPDGARMGDVRAQQGVVGRLDSERAQLDARRLKLETESRQLAEDVEREKAQGAGVRRDFRLQELLAASKAKADELERVAADLKARTQTLKQARRQLIAACDRALAGSQPEASRLELARLRTAQVTVLAMPPQALGIGKASTMVPVVIDPLDGPRELLEKADLLRDSDDKLRREVTRIANHIDDVERRRHLRERAGAVDEDWFGESTVNRRIARAPGTSQGGAPASRGGAEKASADAQPTGGAAAPPAPGAVGGGGTGGSFTNTPTTPAPSGGFSGQEPGGRADATTVLRNLVDPATLDELRRADGSDDLDRQVRALKRAQGELEGLSKELERRAKILSTRAQELKNKK